MTATTVSLLIQIQLHVMLHRVGDDLDVERMLKLENAPRLSRLYVLMASPKFQQGVVFVYLRT